MAMMAATRMPDTGTLEVTAIGFSGGRAFVEGTFAGTLNVSPGVLRSDPLTVTDLRFEVRNLPRTEPAQP